MSINIWFSKAQRLRFVDLDLKSECRAFESFHRYHPNKVNQASFSFQILPHWWQRESIQLGLTLLVFLAFDLSIWWRLHRLRQSELKLKHQVQQKTQALQIQASAFEKQARKIN